MSVSVENAGGRAVDAEINLVPFIDVMSCLVAFLLLTAAWTSMAQLKVSPTGKSPAVIDEQEPPVSLALLVARDAYWVGTTTGERREIRKAGGAYDEAGLASALANYRREGAMSDSRYIEVAAEDGVPYEAIVNATDAAITSGFDAVGYTDPASLSVRFRQ